jgi:hypothetical protein
VDRTVANAFLFIRKELPLSAASHRLQGQRYELFPTLSPFLAFFLKKDIN